LYLDSGASAHLMKAAARGAGRMIWLRWIPHARFRRRIQWFILGRKWTISFSEKNH